jgi:hypothetical protein
VPGFAGRWEPDAGGEAAVPVVDRVVAGLLAAVFAAAGVITIIEIIDAAAGGTYAVVDWPALVAVMARNTWSDVGPKVFGAVCAVVGAVLVAFGVRRRRPRLVALAPYSPGVTAFSSRRDITRALQNSAASVDGVTDVRARVRKRRAKIDANVHPDASTGTRQMIADVAGGRLGSFGLLRPPSVQVTTSPRERRGRHGDGFAPPAAQGLEPPAARERNDQS